MDLMDLMDRNPRRCVAVSISRLAERDVCLTFDGKCLAANDVGEVIGLHM